VNNDRDKCAYYLAQLCANLVLIASPEKIVLGGGLMNRSSLFPKIRDHLQRSLNGYICMDQILTSKIDQFITTSFWGAHAGIVGALHLALFALQDSVQGSTAVQDSVLPPPTPEFLGAVPEPSTPRSPNPTASRCIQSCFYKLYYFSLTRTHICPPS
jgi:hypothetical protein